jgi:uncharacterized protein (TIGR02452 family)
MLAHLLYHFSSYLYPTSDASAEQPSPNVEVHEMDTLQCAESLIKQGLRPLVLNMASAAHAGGGYRHGALAQEETLFYKSTYALSLDPVWNPTAASFYDRDELRGDKAVYSPSVVVFRDADYNLLEWEDCFVVDFVAVAGICLSRSERLTAQQLQLTLAKIRAIFSTAVAYQHDSLVLGALGCGVFRNDPEQVAALFKQVINEPAYRGRFRKIAFAILGEPNYSTFHRILSE